MQTFRIPKQLVNDVKKLMGLIQAGCIPEAMKLNISILNSPYLYDKHKYSGLEILENVGSIARFLEENDHYNFAIPWFKKLCELAVSIDPDSDDTVIDFALLAGCFESIGDYKEALNKIDEALKTFKSAGSNNAELETILNKYRKRLGLISMNP